MARGASHPFPMRCFLVASALLLLMITTLMSVPQARAQTSEGTVHIVPGISSVAADQGSFTVFIELEDLNHHGALAYDDNRDTVPDRQVESNGLAAFEFGLVYDPTVLALAGVEEGPALGRTGRTFQCLPPVEEPGSIRFGCLSFGPEPPGTQGTLTLASVVLRPVGPGTSPLLLDAVLAGPLGSDDVPVTVKGGLARVAGRPLATAVPTFAGGEATATVSGSDGTSPQTPSPADGTATALALLGASRTPGGAIAAPPDGAEKTQELTALGQDFEAQNGSSAGSDGSSAGRALLWSVGAAGGLVAAAALGLAVVVWRRRRHTSGA